eukprot:TRINITY_DN47470_c0_g1_i1.p1 TRINITY_DN47470_c0_g1~~TRINITY_DN47470_c0_g1_i1.p1  ORF type:complete len:351 (+),score=35.79 TRINITY_DN47470_c0_g1_i1:43-1095(+)
MPHSLARRALCLHALFVACCSSSNDPDAGAGFEGDDSCSSLFQVRRSMPQQRTMVYPFDKTPPSSFLHADELPNTPPERKLSQASAASDALAMDAISLISELEGLDSILHVQARMDRTLASSMLPPARAAWQDSRQQTRSFLEEGAWGDHGALPNASPDTKRFVPPSMALSRPQAAWQPSVSSTALGQILPGASYSDSLIGQRFERSPLLQNVENPVSDMLQHEAFEYGSASSSPGSILLSNSTPQQPDTRQQEARKHEDLDEAVRVAGSPHNATGEDPRQKTSIRQMASSHYGTLVLAVSTASLFGIYVCFFCSCYPPTTVRETEQKTARAQQSDGPAGSKRRWLLGCC